MVQRNSKYGNYNYFRDYDAVTGRYIQSDPIGLAGGLNPYVYGAGNPLHYIDALGLDIAVIENGPTRGNPIGHTALAVTGAGVYSFGNDFPGGGSMARYLIREKHRPRDTTVYIIKTTKAQDAAVLKYLRTFQGTDLPKDQSFLSSILVDNCSTRANGALDVALIPYPPVDPMIGVTHTHIPGVAGDRASLAGADRYYVPHDASSFPLVFQLFEPRR